MAWGSPDRLKRREHAACGCQEHRQLLDAIRLRDADMAVQLLDAHLATIESQLHFQVEPERTMALESMLQET
jgi:DNA-binding GntR family transcriptional regulator